MIKVSSILIVLILIFSPFSVSGQEEIEPTVIISSTFNNTFNVQFEKLTKGIVTYTNQINANDATFTGVNQGLALVTLMRLYDLFGSKFLIEEAMEISDFIATNLVDPRYNHLATFYASEDNLISNYRASVDNFIASWGLKMLSDRIDPSDELTKKIHEDRFNFIFNDLERFIGVNKFIESFRIDVSSSSSSLFNVYSNLMTSFIITESEADLFSLYEPLVLDVYNFVKDNISTSDGGIYTIYKNGFHDNLVTLTNTALFVKVALNLFESTNEQQYLDDAIKSMDFINKEFYDIGVTGGYFEAVEDGIPVQQSKSLYSHAILLLNLVNLVNLGQTDYRIDLLALWNTINQYFRTDSGFYYSSITRNGESASQSISIQDNMMMLLALTFLPLVLGSEYFDEIDFRNQLVFNTSIQVPENINSELIFAYNVQDFEPIIYKIKGSENPQFFSFEITPPRPLEESQKYLFNMTLITQGITTDIIFGSFTIFLESGIDLSFEVITIFSILAILSFVLFINKATNLSEQLSMSNDKSMEPE